MAQNKNKIVIIEPSEIIREGLMRILSEYFPEFSVLTCANVNAVENHHLFEQGVFLVILNPAVLSAGISRLPDVLTEYSQAKRVGLITTVHQRNAISLFDDLIYLTDDRETIIEIVKKQVVDPSKKIVHKEKLTNRELDVLGLLVKGFSNKQIADELYISIHTVITHRKNITSKLGIKSIAGLAIYGVINNIIDVDDYLDTHS